MLKTLIMPTIKNQEEKWPIHGFFTKEVFLKSHFV